MKWLLADESGLSCSCKFEGDPQGICLLVAEAWIPFWQDGRELAHSLSTQEDAGSSETPLLEDRRFGPSLARGNVCAWVILQKTSERFFMLRSPVLTESLENGSTRLQNLSPNLVFGILLLNIYSESAANRKNMLNERSCVGRVLHFVLHSL